MRWFVREVACPKRLAVGSLRLQEVLGIFVTTCRVLFWPGWATSGQLRLGVCAAKCGTSTRQGNATLEMNLLIQCLGTQASHKPAHIQRANLALMHILVTHLSYKPHIHKRAHLMPTRACKFPRDQLEATCGPAGSCKPAREYPHVLRGAALGIPLNFIRYLNMLRAAPLRPHPQDFIEFQMILEHFINLHQQSIHFLRGTPIRMSSNLVGHPGVFHGTPQMLSSSPTMFLYVTRHTL